MPPLVGNMHIIAEEREMWNPPASKFEKVPRAFLRAGSTERRLSGRRRGEERESTSNANAERGADPESVEMVQSFPTEKTNVPNTSPSALVQSKA